MLSYYRGKPIAVHCEDGTPKFIYIHSECHSILSPKEAEAIMKLLRSGAPVSGKDMEELLEEIDKRLVNEGDSFKTMNGSLYPLINHGNINSSHILMPGPDGSWKYRFISKCLPLSNHGKRTWVFSHTTNEGYLNRLNPCRLIINDEIADNPIALHELENSTCIFDDIESMTNHAVREALKKLRNKILKSGGSHNISTISTVTFPIKKPEELKHVVSHSPYLALYPNHEPKYTKKFLKCYGLHDHTIHKIIKTPCRWMMLHLGNPNYGMHENGVFTF